MLFFPQLESGATAQFPFSTVHAVSLITTLQEDGSRYASSSTGPPQITWTLNYMHLSKAEANTLSSFFLSVQGRLVPFTFLDPTGNLVLWSEDFSQPIWDKSPFVTTASLYQDSLAITQIGSSGAGVHTVSQILPCPGAALVCFSVYARADGARTLKLSVSGSDQSFNIDTKWAQVSVTQAGTDDEDFKSIQLSFESGPIELSRLSVSSQPAPGSYVGTREAGGIIPNARFDQDSLAFTAWGKNDFSCKVRLTSWLT